MMKVGALAFHLLVRLGEYRDRLASAIAPVLAPRDPSLRCLESALSGAVPARMEDASTIREGSECL